MQVLLELKKSKAEHEVIEISPQKKMLAKYSALGSVVKMASERILRFI